MSDKKMICSSCGESVAIGKFCPKCGVALAIKPVQEFEIQKERLEEAKKSLVNFETTILKTLAPDYHIKYNEIKIGIESVILKLELDIKHQKTDGKKQTKTICLKCGEEVAYTKFCQNCGNFLGEFGEDNKQAYAQHLLSLQNNILAFRRTVEKILAKEALGDLNRVYNNVRQVILFFTKQETQVTKAAQVAKTEKAVDQKKIAKSWQEVYEETKVLKEKPEPKPKQDTKPVKTSSTTITKEEKSIPEQRESTLYSRFERNLLDYWFFYLATIIFSVGISITLYFVSVEMESKIWQLVIIYSIGAVIIIAGQALALMMKRRKKKKEEKMRATQITDEKKETPTEEKIKYTPQMSGVILFIGFVVLFVGGIIGILSYQSLGVSKGIFIGLSLGLSAVCMAISVINKSEFLALTSILEAIVFVAADLLWAQYPPILNNITSLIVFILLIISSTCIAVFFKKWTVTATTMAILPVLLCIPRVYNQIGLEFIILCFIPIMVMLTIQFGSEKTPMPIKRSFVVLSFLLPLVAIFVITLTSYFRPGTEPAWSSYQSYQSLIIGVIFLGTSYYYQFIQEKHLDIKTSNEIIWFAGQIFTGIVSFLNVGLYRDTLITSLFFLIFFVFGILSTMKLFREKLSIENIITSFLISEVLAILVIVLVNITKTYHEVLIFLLVLSFTAIAIVSLFIPHFLHRPSILFLVWFGLGIINLILLGLIDKINPWFIFVIVALGICGSIISSLPVIIPKVPNWRYFSTYSILLNGIVVVVLLLFEKFDFFDYIPLIVFILFFIATVPSFINWKKEEVIANE